MRFSRIKKKTIIILPTTRFFKDDGLVMNKCSAKRLTFSELTCISYRPTKLYVTVAFRLKRNFGEPSSLASITGAVDIVLKGRDLEGY